MARRISIATGNFTAAGTWGLVDDTSYVDTDSFTSSTTTSFVESQSFTPGAITIDGIAIKISTRTASPIGTISVRLSLAAAAVLGTTVTINGTDVENQPSSSQGWVFFKFTAPVLLLAATAYTVGISSSTAGTISIFRNFTAGDWARILRTTTTGAPASGDQLHIIGERTGAGTNNSFIVTMDNTATTSFGPTVSGGPPQGITIGSGGTLTFGTAAATNYYLKYKGVLAVFSGGTLNIGTSGARIPSNSSAVLEMDSAANVDSGLSVFAGATVNIYGNQKFATTAITAASNATPIEITSTSHGLVAGDRITIASVGGNTAANATWEVIASTGANTFTVGQINGAAGGGVGTSTGSGAYTSGGTWQRLAYTRLTSDEAAAQTVIGPMLSTAGWAASDELVFTSTTRTASDCEKKTITTVDSATQVTLSAGLTVAHSGTSPTQCEIGNITRNVKVRGVSSSLQGYCFFQTTSTVNIDHAEFTQLGSATANKRGINVTTTTGTFSMTYCSIHDSPVASSESFNFNGTANVTFSNNVTFSVTSVSLDISATAAVWIADANLIVLNASGTIVNLGDVGGTFTNNIIAGATTIGLTMTEAGATVGTNAGNTIHGCTTTGLQITTLAGGTVSALSAWRNGGAGISIATWNSEVTFNTVDLFGNTTSNITAAGAASEMLAMLFVSVTSSGDTTFATTSGLFLSTAPTPDMVFESSTFGVASGIRTAHTQDIACGTGYATVILRNCLLASATEVSSQSSLSSQSYIRSQKHDQAAASHKSWHKYGTMATDTTIFNTASPSLRMTPNNTSSKLATHGGAIDQKGSFPVQVQNGNTCTVSVSVRKSVVGDGTAYNGNQPRLIVLKNVAAGIAADTVLATAAGAAGSWETLSGTTIAVTDAAVLKFVVDCDGTTGWVNVDDWSTTTISDNPKGMKYWSDGAPVNMPSTGGMLATPNLEGT